MFSLQNKVAFITGATGGIGEAIARTLAAQGARVALGGTRVEKLEALAADIGGDALTFPCNIAESGSEKVIEEVAAKAGRLDILVNNAGITRDGLAMRMGDKDWQDVLDVNLTAAFRLSRAALKIMLKQRHGRIINIGSVVGSSGNAGQTNYAASKAGLIGLSKSMAQEVAARNITVNVIAPGYIATDMTAKLNEEQQQRIIGHIPSGRMGQPNDIAASAAFLASDEAAYVTGVTLHVNGGLYFM
ncbi:MAG: 3-oxoacyl-[acyl-carrier-protein] reductase [Alphaproteobacteria bacterium]